MHFLMYAHINIICVKCIIRSQSIVLLPTGWCKVSVGWEKNARERLKIFTTVLAVWPSWAPWLKFSCRRSIKLIETILLISNSSQLKKILVIFISVREFFVVCSSSAVSTLFMFTYGSVCMRIFVEVLMIINTINFNPWMIFHLLHS